MKFKFQYLLLPLLLAFIACSGGNSKEDNQTLPILGNYFINSFEMEGKTVSDTVFHKIGEFSFLNQEGETVDNSTTAGKVYVADFFFTSCPTICPVMKTQMLRIFEQFKDNSDFMILSHSIDPKHDTVALLKDYALRLGVENADTWNFLTGDQEMLFEIGQTSYMTTAMEDKNEAGGYLHSGAFILVDQNSRIRGVYDGTKADQVDKLIRDIPKLLESK
jgi:protein SCO1